MYVYTLLFQVLRVFGEESGLSLGLAGYRSLAVSCNYRQRGLRLLADMKVCVRERESVCECVSE